MGKNVQVNLTQIFSFNDQTKLQLKIQVVIYIFWKKNQQAGVNILIPFRFGWML